MSQDHHLLDELKSICKHYRINHGKAVLALELYMELCEVFKLWEVEHHFYEKLCTFYLTGKLNEKDDSYNVYVPVSVNETFSVKYLEELQRSLSPLNNSLILVFKDHDSSSTHYRITQGLVRPDSPTTTQRKKTTGRKYFQYKKYITKWRKNLYTKALEDEKQQS